MPVLRRESIPESGEVDAALRRSELLHLSLDPVGNPPLIGRVDGEQVTHRVDYIIFTVSLLCVYTSTEGKPQTDAESQMNGSS